MEQVADYGRQKHSLKISWCREHKWWTGKAALLWVHRYIYAVSMLFNGCSQPTTEHREVSGRPVSTKCRTPLTDYVGSRTPHHPGQNFLKALLQSYIFLCILPSFSLSQWSYFCHAMTGHPASSSFLHFPPHKHFFPINLALLYLFCHLLLWGPELIFIPIGMKLKCYSKIHSLGSHSLPGLVI